MRHARAWILGAVAAVSIVAVAQAEPPADYGLLAPTRRGGASLRYGQRGPAVAALQHALTEAGVAVSATSSFDWATWVAVRTFQRRERCAVDGVVGPETMRALDRVLGWTPATTPAPTPPPAPVAPGIPARAAGAATGSQFLARTRGLSRPAREAEILRELRAGNVPDFLRRLSTVTVTGGAAGAIGGGRTVVLRVLPDYLAIGTDADFVRIPMGAPTAQAVADAWGYLLPTRRIVDLCWRQAAVRLRPQPLPAGPAMMSNDYFATHHARVEAQRAGQPLGVLTAGHKKDIVITPQLVARPAQVAIYGWHQPDGRPIQGLSLVHEATYADYSHGVRLVHPELLVDGVADRYDALLRDPARAGLLSDEGVIARPRYR